MQPVPNGPLLFGSSTTGIMYPEPGNDLIPRRLEMSYEESLAPGNEIDLHGDHPELEVFQRKVLYLVDGVTMLPQAGVQIGRRTSGLAFFLDHPRAGSPRDGLADVYGKRCSFIVGCFN